MAVMCPAMMQETRDSLTSYHQVEGGNLRYRRRQKQIEEKTEGKDRRFLLRAAGESPPCLPHTPRCLYTTDMRLRNLMDRQTVV